MDVVFCCRISVPESAPKEEAVPHTRAGDCGIYSGARAVTLSKKIRNAHRYAKMLINAGRYIANRYSDTA